MKTKKAIGMILFSAAPDEGRPKDSNISCIARCKIFALAFFKPSLKNYDMRKSEESCKGIYICKLS